MNENAKGLPSTGPCMLKYRWVTHSPIHGVADLFVGFTFGRYGAGLGCVILHTSLGDGFPEKNTMIVTLKTACVHHILTKSIRALIKNNKIRSIYPEKLASYFMQLSTHKALGVFKLHLFNSVSINKTIFTCHPQRALWSMAWKAIGFSASNLFSVRPHYTVDT